MSPSEETRPKLYGILVGALLLAVAALWLPRWWENREYRKAETIAGIGSRILPGTLVDARAKIEAGAPAEKVASALGPASLTMKTEGASVHEIWTYYYADGTLRINLTDGYVARVSTEFGPPRIRRSRRP